MSKGISNFDIYFFLQKSVVQTRVVEKMPSALKENIVVVRKDMVVIRKFYAQVIKKNARLSEQVRNPTEYSWKEIKSIS